MRMLAEISLCNRLTVSLLRARADKWSVAQPPEEVPPNTTLAWQVEDEGSVTYDLVPEDGERGVVKRFTLQWSLAPDGVVHCLVQDAARSLSIQIEQRPDGVLCTVTSRRRRVPPPPRRGRLLARLVPLTAGIVVVTLLGATLTALGSPFGGHRGGTPTAHRSATTATITKVTRGPTVTVAPPKPAPAHVASGSSTGGSGGNSSGGTSGGPPPPPPSLSVSPSGTTAVNCFGSSVAYPSITVRNTGGQTLTWSAASSNGAASLSPANGSLPANGSQQLHVTQAGPASTATTVSILSNGGNATVSFTCIPPSAQLKVTQNQNASETCSGPVAPPYTVILDNTASNVSVGWQFDAASYGSWASASPASGTVPDGQTASLQVTPNTCAAAGQAHTYQAALHLSFPQGGSEPDIALTDATTGPPLPPPNLTVNPTQVAFGGACGASATVTLGNSGGQTLSWLATTSDSSIEVNIATGSLGGGQTQVLTITGTSSSSSRYVYITSNGGNATITVNYGCPY